ncbi:MAG: D-alanine--D-alanine ligase family protein [Myxococcota bacterium]
MKVAVLIGGRSGEHDVSLVTGRAVSDALDRIGWPRFELLLGREGGASWPGGEGTVADGLSAMARWEPDAAFIAMHGTYGEDGRVQGALEMLDVPYQGSGVAASAVALDKARTKQVYEAVGLPVARDRVLTRRALAAGIPWEGLVAGLGLPLVLKTAESGSSVGVEVVERAGDLPRRAEALLRESDRLVVESWLPGAELTCPVLEDADGTPEALPLIEIRPRGGGWFDYDTKYDPEAVDELCPAPVDEALAAEVSRLGLLAHEALGCRHYSRTDFKLDAEGRPRVLETNTLPGLTPASLVPKSAAEAGIAFDDLIRHLLELAVG